MVYEEARIVHKRRNNMLASEAALYRLAMASVHDKKSGRRFNQTITRLTQDG